MSGIGDKAFEYTASGSAGGGIAIFVFKYNVVMQVARGRAPHGRPAHLHRSKAPNVARTLYIGVRAAATNWTPRVRNAESHAAVQRTGAACELRSAHR